MPTGPDLEHPPTLTQRAVPSERFPLGRRSAPISVFPPQRLDLLLRDVGAVVATAPRISNVLVAPMPRPTLAGPPGPRPTGLNHGRYRRGGRGARGSPKRRRPLPVRFRGACREVARRVRGAQIPAAIVGMVKMPPRPRQDRLAAPRARHPAPLDEPAPALPCRLVGGSVCSRPFQSFVGPFFVGEGNPNRGAVARRLSPKKRSATHNPLPGKPPRPGLSPRLSYGGGWRPSPAERQPRPSWVLGVHDPRRAISCACRVRDAVVGSTMRRSSRASASPPCVFASQRTSTPLACSARPHAMLPSAHPAICASLASVGGLPHALGNGNLRSRTRLPVAVSIMWWPSIARTRARARGRRTLFRRCAPRGIRA
jgi:hypothetical protein